MSHLLSMKEGGVAYHFSESKEKPVRRWKERGVGNITYGQTPEEAESSNTNIR